jgi:hypothetical protein
MFMSAICVLFLIISPCHAFRLGDASMLSRSPFSVRKVIDLSKSASGPHRLLPSVKHSMSLRSWNRLDSTSLHLGTSSSYLEYLDSLSGKKFRSYPSKPPVNPPQELFFVDKLLMKISSKAMV